MITDFHISEQAQPLPRDIPAAARKAAYLERLDELRRKINAIENETIADLAIMFDQMSLEVAEIVRREYDAARAQKNIAATVSEIENLQDLIDDRTKELLREFERKFKDRLDEAAKAGSAAVDELLEVLGEDALAEVGLTKAHLQEVLLLQDFSADLITEVSAQIINQINTQIRMGVLGGIAPAEMITNIERILDFEPGKGLAAVKPIFRAERIVRTEIGRIYSLAEQLRGEEYEKEGIEVVKTWNHSGLPPDRARPGHMEMQGQERKIGEDFVNPLTGNRLEFPRDPSAPAEEVVNCGCFMTLVNQKYRDLFE